MPTYFQFNGFYIFLFNNLIKFIGEKADISSFSKFLHNYVTFHDFAECAMSRERAKYWIEKNEFGDFDVMLNNLYKKINSKLLSVLVKTIRDNEDFKKSSEKSSYHINLFSIIQTRSIVLKMCIMTKAYV